MKFGFILLPELVFERGAFRVLLGGDKIDEKLIRLASVLKELGTEFAYGNEIDLHFVNYDRDELPKRANGKPNHGRGPADERPKAVPETNVSFVLPEGIKVSGVEVISPEYEKSLLPDFRIADGRISFSLPKFLVYAVARLKH